MSGDRLQNPRWHASGDNYWTRHARIYSARGKAAEFQCVQCPAQAYDWAHIHGMDPLNVYAYMPMCRKCHLTYDKVGEPKRKLTASQVRHIRRQAGLKS